MVDFPHTTPAVIAALHPCFRLLHGSTHSLMPALGHINGVQPSVATSADESNTAAKRYLRFHRLHNKALNRTVDGRHGLGGSSPPVSFLLAQKED